MADQIRGAFNYGRVPDPLLLDRDMPGDACKLYATLTRYWQQKERVVPGRPELADRLGWSPDKLDKMTGRLEATGLLYVERRQGNDGRNLRSVYWIDGARPPGVDPSRRSAATPSRRSAATTTSGNGELPSSDPSRRSAAQERVEQDQSNSATTVAGAEGAASEEAATPQTILARLIDYIRQSTGDEHYRPDQTSIGKLTRGFAQAIDAGATVEQIDVGARDWADAQPAKDASLVGSFIDGRRRRNGRSRTDGTVRVRDGEPFTNAPRPVDHDGKHDESCWCFGSTKAREGLTGVNRTDLYAALGTQPPDLGGGDEPEDRPDGEPTRSVDEQADALKEAFPDAFVDPVEAFFGGEEDEQPATVETGPSPDGPGSAQ